MLRDASRAEVLPRFRRVDARAKSDGTLVTEADLAMQRHIGEALWPLDPSIPLLGEEMSPDEQERLIAGAANGFWCLDPLDGTTNFASGFPFFAVSLALIREATPEMGAVYDPIRDECFAATRGGGCWLNGSPLRLAPRGVGLAEALAVVDLKRLGPAIRQRLAEHAPYRSQRNLGAVALEWCWLAAGRFQLYLHGGQGLWDYAAGSLILEEAGGVGQLLDGQPNPSGPLGLEPRLAVAAETPRLFGEWREWLGL